MLGQHAVSGALCCRPNFERGQRILHADPIPTEPACVGQFLTHAVKVEPSISKIPNFPRGGGFCMDLAILVGRSSKQD